MNKDDNGRRAIRRAAKKNQSRIVSNRLGVLFMIVLLAFVGLGLRVIFITKENNNEYKQRILSQ